MSVIIMTDKVVILFKFPLTYCTISVPTSQPWTAISVRTLDVAPVWLIAHVMSAEEMGVTLALPSLPSSSPSPLLSTLWSKEDGKPPNSIMIQQFISYSMTI